MNRRSIENFKGCIIGGAIGDALGAPIEFISIDKIRSYFGRKGLTDYSEAYGRIGRFTDLTGYKELFSLRAPGNSCLSALRSKKKGTMKSPVNNSKGCGGVMRMAPVGLAFKDAEKAFKIGCECATLTHGHPTGYLASGAFASIISKIISGTTLISAIDDSISILKNKKNSKETLAALDTAIELAGKSTPGPDVIKKLERVGSLRKHLV